MFPLLLFMNCTDLACLTTCKCSEDELFFYQIKNTNQQPCEYLKLSDTCADTNCMCFWM